MDTVTNENITSILESIASNTTNDLILFSIIILLGLSIVMLPLFVVSTKNTKDLRKRNADEKSMLITIVDNNTKAITQLSMMLDSNNKTTLESLRRIHERIDHNSDILHSLNSRQIEINDKLEHTSDSIDVIRNKL